MRETHDFFYHSMTSQAREKNGSVSCSMEPLSSMDGKDLHHDMDSIGLSAHTGYHLQFHWIHVEPVMPS